MVAGSEPDIHDLFLRVDEAIWQLGSSLNEFGDRCIMLVALPDPDAISPKLQAAWGRAEPRANWIAAGSLADVSANAIGGSVGGSDERRARAGAVGSALAIGRDENHRNS